MRATRKITAEQFMKIYNKAAIIDYAGAYMTIQDDDEDFVFLPNCEGESELLFPKSIIDNGVFVNRFNDMFCFDSAEHDCEWFALHPGALKFEA